MRKLRDRKDAKRITKLTGMGQLIMDINPKRCDSEVYINRKIDVTELCKYLKKKKEEGMEVTVFHALLAGLGKVMYNRPKLNYFVSNRHVYEHNDIVISFVAKVAFEDHAEEMMIMVPVHENDNLESISKLVKGKVDKVRDKKKEYKKEGANDIIDYVGKFPNIIRVPFVGFLKWLDKHGWLPNSIMKDNLYYSSMIVSNLGPLHSNAIYHHLSEFGTCSGLATMGEIEDEIVLIDGKQETRKMLELGITLDERIADGYYFIKAVKMFEYIMNNPELLEEEASKEVEVK